MKILIVNGYSDSQEGLKNFMGFRYLVQKIFFEQTIIIDMDIEFVIRKINELDELLYESTSTSVKTSSAKNFDNYDIIFIAGDPHHRPWSKKNRNIQILIRMCMRVRKYLFASGVGMETLVFQSATNFDRPINIINGDEGGRLTEMVSYSKQAINLSIPDYFLDSSTGDLYSFSDEKQEWNTKINTGFHSTLAVQTYSTIGKYLIKAPTYRPKNTIEISSQSNATFVSKNTEKICYLKKQYILHWAFKDMPGNHFLVQKKSKWDVHPFSFTNSETTFITLAESDSGPLIICYGDYIMGCQFEIIPKYFESIIPLKNFIYNKLTLISENKQSKISILSVNSSIQQADVMRDMRLRAENNNQRSINLNKISNQQRSNTPVKMNQTFRNSGHAATSKNIGIIVQENAVGNSVIKLPASTNDLSPLKKRYMNTTHHEKLSQMEKEFQDKTNQESNLQISLSQINLQNGYNVRSKSSINSKQNRYQKSLPSFEQILSGRFQEIGQGQYEGQHEEEEDPITRDQVRRQLHPFMNKELMYEQSQKMPCSLKEREKKPAIRVKQQEDLFKGHFHKMIKDEKQQTQTQNLIKSSTLSRIGSMQNLSTISVQTSEPYRSQVDIMKDYEKGQSQKNIGPKNLVFSLQRSRIHQADPSYIQNYVSLSPTKTSARNYQYREISKNNWVSTNNFLLQV